MSHYLNINQLAEEAARQGLTNIVALLEATAQHVAEVIAARRGDVRVTEEASNEPGFGGLCVGFGPVKLHQPCPTDFIDYDASSTWAEQSKC